MRGSGSFTHTKLINKYNLTANRETLHTTAKKNKKTKTENKFVIAFGESVLKANMTEQILQFNHFGICDVKIPKQM